MRRDYYFNADAACLYGVDGAIMLHHLVYWVVYNYTNDQGERDGKVWTYNSARAFKTFFRWWSADQIRRVLTNLERDGAIITGSFNKLGMDRTKWYTVTDKVAEIYELDMPQFGKAPTPFGETSESISGNPQMHLEKPRHQYQVTNTKSKPVINQVMLPWDDDAFKSLWNEWKQDRKERKIKSYTHRGEQAALHKLQKDSGNDVAQAILMIQNSIANGYQGIFPARNSNTKQSTQYDTDKLREWASQGRT